MRLWFNIVKGMGNAVRTTTLTHRIQPFGRRNQD